LDLKTKCHQLTTVSANEKIEGFSFEEKKGSFSVLRSFLLSATRGSSLSLLVVSPYFGWLSFT